jgi:hypothetical protein
MEVIAMGGKGMPQNMKDMNKILDLAETLDNEDFDYVYRKMYVMSTEREQTKEPKPESVGFEVRDAVGRAGSE